MSILFTGGTGFLGTAIKRFLNTSIIQLTRNPQNDNDIRSLDEIDAKENIEAIINLAGEPIADKRWSLSQKHEILNSRLETTQNIVRLVDRLENKPRVILSGSAIGYYGYTNKPCDESCPSQDVFVSNLCKEWEQAISPVKKHGIRVCILRTGVVLQKSKGMLAKMELPFKMGVGGKIGSGEQYISWIHIDDYVNIVKLLIENENMQGAFNCTAPNPVTNLEFSKTFAKVLYRPCILPMPSFIVKLIFGEMGDALLLRGQNIIPGKLIESGFSFQYPLLSDALRDLYIVDSPTHLKD